MRKDPSGYWSTIGIKVGDLPGHPFRGNQYTEGQGGSDEAHPVEQRASRLLGAQPTASTHGYLWSGSDTSHAAAIEERVAAAGFRKVSDHSDHGERRAVYQDKKGNRVHILVDHNTGTFGGVNYIVTYRPVNWEKLRGQYDTLIETPHEVGRDLRRARPTGDLQALQQTVQQTKED